MKVFLHNFSAQRNSYYIKLFMRPIFEELKRIYETNVLTGKLIKISPIHHEVID